jgi:hypothetical protein
MEKEEKKKPIKARYLLFIAVLVFMFGSLLLGKISKSFLGALSNKDEMVESETPETGSEEIDFNEMVNGIMGNEEASSVSEDADSSDLGPEEAYLVMRKELVKVKDIDGFVAFAEKYGSEKNISYAKQLEKIMIFVGEEEVMSAITSALSEEIRSAETVSSSENKATVKLVTESGKEGQVLMVFERGSWRFDSEKW